MTVFQNTGQYLIKEQQLQHDDRRVATAVASVGKTALIADAVFLAFLIVIPKSFCLFQAVAIALPLIGTLTVAPWVLIALGVFVLGIAVIGMGAFGEEISNAVIRFRSFEQKEYDAFAGDDNFKQAFDALLEDEPGDWEIALLAFIEGFEGDENRSVFFKKTKCLFEKILWINACRGYQTPLTEEKIARVKDGIRRVQVFLENHEREEGKTRLILEKYNPEVPRYRAIKSAHSLNQAKGLRVRAVIVCTVTSVALSVFSALASTGVATSLTTYLLTPIVVGSIGIPFFIPIVAAVALSALLLVGIASLDIAARQRQKEKFSAKELEYGKISQYIESKPMQAVENYLINTSPSQFSQMDERNIVSKAITSKGVFDAQKLAILREGLTTLKKTVHLDHQSIQRIDHLLEQLSPLRDSTLEIANAIIQQEEVNTNQYSVFFALNWLGLVQQEQFEELMETTHHLITIDALPELIQQLHLVPDQAHSLLIYRLVQDFIYQKDVIYQLIQNTKDSYQVSSLLEAMLMSDPLIEESILRNLCKLLLEEGVTDQAEKRYLQMVQKLPYNSNVIGMEGNALQSNIRQGVKILSCIASTKEEKEHLICELARFAHTHYQEEFLTFSKTLLLAIEDPEEQIEVIYQLLETSHEEEYCVLLQRCVPEVSKTQKAHLLQMIINEYQDHTEKIIPILKTTISAIPQKELQEILTYHICSSVETFDEMIWILSVEEMTKLFVYMGKQGKVEHIGVIERALAKSAYPTEEFAKLLIKLYRIKDFDMDQFLPIFLEQREHAIDHVKEECTRVIGHFCMNGNDQVIDYAKSLLRVYDENTQTDVIVNLIHQYATEGHHPFFKKLLAALIEQFTAHNESTLEAVIVTLNEVKISLSKNDLFDLMSNIFVKESYIQLLDNVDDALEFFENYIPKQLWGKSFKAIDKSLLTTDACVELALELIKRNNKTSLFIIDVTRWIDASTRVLEIGRADVLFKIYIESENQKNCLENFRWIFLSGEHFDKEDAENLCKKILNYHSSIKEKEEIFLWIMHMEASAQKDQEVLRSIILDELHDDSERDNFLMQIFPKSLSFTGSFLLFIDLLNSFSKENQLEIIRNFIQKSAIQHKIQKFIHNILIDHQSLEKLGLEIYDTLLREYILKMKLMQECIFKQIIDVHGQSEHIHRILEIMISLIPLNNLRYILVDMDSSPELFDLMISLMIEQFGDDERKNLFYFIVRESPLHISAIKRALDIKE